MNRVVVRGSATRNGPGERGLSKGRCQWRGGRGARRRGFRNGASGGGIGSLLVCVL